MLLNKAFKFFSKIRPPTNRLFNTSSVLLQDNEDSDEQVEEILRSDSDYNEISENYFQIGEAHRCYIIQPYVKWGPDKLKISPQEQLEEAVALINTLPRWQVEDTISIPLDTLNRKTIFKSGSMEKLEQTIQKNHRISAVFLNIGNLKPLQMSILQQNFKKPILDRYKVVMQILKMHATSKHAKLQVALAELYYLQRKTLKDLLFHTSNSEDLKMMFHRRETKLKTALTDLRNQRALLRNRRTKKDYPVIAVVGYTNSGKTCLIKALTGEEKLQPKNQLFATLDVTMHSGIFPSGLEVLYVDTVGFLSDIPTNLIECFVATLEDAVLADIILHVEDVSSSSFEYKRAHVLKTLQNLGSKMESEDIMSKVLSVGNKCDLVDNLQDLDIQPISAKLGTGLEDLRMQLEQQILKVTGRRQITIKVMNGGDEIRWLYKNATVVSEIVDEANPQLIKASVIINNAKLQQFKHNFI